MNSYTDHKLINFNVPKYLIKNFDNLVRFKRVSRTSMLIHLMENYIRLEKIRMDEDNTLNLMISEVENRSRKSIKEELVGLQKEISEELEPPMIPMMEDDYSKDDWSDISGLNRLFNL